VTGQVLADSGSSFRQSVLINVGQRDGIREGWATMDGVGLVGRISGVGRRSSRVILLTDSNSRIPVTLRPSGQRALLSGDNSAYPVLDFLENPEALGIGDRVVSSGDGGVFPADILIGQMIIDGQGRQRAILSADYQRLKFVRVLRSSALEAIPNEGILIIPQGQDKTNTQVTAPDTPPPLTQANAASAIGVVANAPPPPARTAGQP
jgi:rod shape-determining protein MreC